MKIKYLKLESGDNFNLNPIKDEEVKKEYLKIRDKFRLENNTLKIKDTFQKIDFLLKFNKNVYVKSINGSIRLIENHEIKTQEKSYEKGFLKGYKKATIPDINNIFQILKDGFDFIYGLPEKRYNEKFLIINKPTPNKETYFDEEGRLKDYYNLCFKYYGKSVGEYIARWDALINYYVNGDQTQQFTLQENNRFNIEKPLIEKREKLNHKWYALYYWIKLNSNAEQPPRNDFDDYKSNELKIIGKKIIEEKEKDIGTLTTGQGFYVQFKKVEAYLNNEKLLKSNIGINWKEKIIELSNNDKTIIKYIKEKYSS